MAAMFNIDRHIGVSAGWIAGPAFAVSMMAAPEYFHLGPIASAILFWGGIVVFLATIAVLAFISFHEEGRRRAVTGPIIVMVLGALIFCGGTAWYFWPRQAISEGEPKPESAGELLLECQLAPLPEVGLPNQTMLFKIDPFRFIDLGMIGYGTMPSEPGKPLKWPEEWKNRSQSSARCRVTNYGKTTLFNLQIPFKMTFVQIERGENPGSTVGNKIINVEDGMVPITKLEPGNEAAYVFYIHNQGRDIVQPQFADNATCLPLGGNARTSVKVIQPADVMHHAGAIWPVRDATEIVNGTASSKSPPALLPPVPLPPNRQGKK
jgi:hypothetical protein